MGDSDETVSAEKLYDVVKTSYDEETKRYSDLNDRAKFYLSIVGVYGAAALFKSDSLHSAAERDVWTKALAIATATVLGLSVASVALSARLCFYETPFEPKDVIEELDDDDEINPAVFYGARLADIAVAVARNSVTNDERARWLDIALYALVMGILFNVIFIVVLI
jgi:hypothetical protein